ncbi:MAG: 2OG-Fe(II) oxygenase [Candidatus Eutrophobiaceae bacterium]
MFSEILNPVMSIQPSSEPFAHWILEDFLVPALALKVEREFPLYEADSWNEYRNAIEEKKTINNYNVFGEHTYRVFLHLNSPRFVEFLHGLIGTELYPDFGLHGGGLHIHRSGGNLNPHLDYSIHPKMGKKRAYNLIVYLSSKLVPSRDGGHLALYPDIGGEPDFANASLVETKFNRAVLFDVRGQNWHGMHQKFIPGNPDIQRKSIAAYYLSNVGKEQGQPRMRAKFHPRPEQKGHKEILELIDKRGSLHQSKEVYIDKIRER